MPETVLPFIPYGRHSLSGPDTRSILSVLKSDRIAQGPQIGKFEEKLARFCTARYAVAVSSGTAALHLASLVLGLKTGDEVITSPISFIATSNSVLYTGARPVFADIEAATLNLSAEEVRKKVSKKTKAVYPVHFTGLACRMAELSRAAKGVQMVEDACHALGARYRAGSSWVRVGSCRHSRLTVFSFHPVKHITTGEGGALTTNDAELYRRLCALRTHGVYPSENAEALSTAWPFEMRELGFNYRMTDLQAALGISQLERVQEFIEKRRAIAQFYTRELKNLPGLELPVEPEGFYHAYHLYVVRVHGQAGRRKKLMQFLHESRIGSQVHYRPIYQQPYYRSLGYRDRCAEAERYFTEALSLPIYPDLSRAQQKRVIGALKKFL